MSEPGDRSAPELGLKRALDGARVGSAVQRRVVAGALDRAATSRRVPWRLGLVAAGATVALAVAVLMVSRGRGGDLPAAGTLAEGTAGGRVLQLGPHRATIEPDGALFVERAEPDTTVLEVRRGGAHFSVARLGAQQAFEVKAGPASVHVVGTEFSVSLRGGCAHVEVQEGRVRVQHGGGTSTLGRGESGDTCPARVADEQQERLIREAIALVGGGPEDQAQARALFARYRSRYPSGVFGEEALFYLWYLEGRGGAVAQQRALGEQFIREFPRSERAERVRQWLTENGP